MAAKMRDNNLPTSFEDDAPKNSITFANEVVAVIAGIAANEVEGIAGMCSVNTSILGKNRNITKGVKVEIGVEEVSVDLYVIVEYGTPIQKACLDAQESVRKAIESMTGLHVVRVDVHVQSVSFEKENKALQAGKEQAVLEPGMSAEPVTEPEEPKEQSETTEDSTETEETDEQPEE